MLIMSDTWIRNGLLIDHAESPVGSLRAEDSVYGGVFWTLAIAAAPAHLPR